MVDRGFGFPPVLGDGCSFASGEPVGLDHPGGAEVVEGLGGFHWVCESVPAGCRYVELGAEALGETLRGFNSRSAPVRPKNSEATFTERINYSKGERSLGTDNCLVDAMFEGEGEE